MPLGKCSVCQDARCEPNHDKYPCDCECHNLDYDAPENVGFFEYVEPEGNEEADGE